MPPSWGLRAISAGVAFSRSHGPLVLAGPESLIELRKPGSRTLSLGTVTLSLAPKPAGTLYYNFVPA